VASDITENQGQSPYVYPQGPQERAAVASGPSHLTPQSWASSAGSQGVLSFRALQGASHYISRSSTHSSTNLALPETLTLYCCPQGSCLSPCLAMSVSFHLCVGPTRIGAACSQLVPVTWNSAGHTQGSLEDTTQ
jgi:hypothetical protein